MMSDYCFLVSRRAEEVDSAWVDGAFPGFFALQRR